MLVLLTAALGSAQQTQGSARADALREEIEAQERAELDSLKTGDIKAFANFLAGVAVFVDARGSADKAGRGEEYRRFSAV